MSPGAAELGIGARGRRRGPAWVAGVAAVLCIGLAWVAWRGTPLQRLLRDVDALFSQAGHGTSEDEDVRVANELAAKVTPDLIPKLVEEMVRDATPLERRRREIQQVLPFLPSALLAVPDDFRRMRAMLLLTLALERQRADVVRAVLAGAESVSLDGAMAILIVAREDDDARVGIAFRFATNADPEVRRMGAVELAGLPPEKQTAETRRALEALRADQVSVVREAAVRP